MAENAILAINSLDRYITSKPGQQNQPLGNALQQQYFLTITPGNPQDGGESAGPPCNNFTISSPGAILYGYIDRIIVSQIQLYYNIPTVIPGVNDTFYIIQGNVANISTLFVQITIPFGFYTPDELAATLQVLIRQSSIGQPGFAPEFTVSYTATNSVYEQSISGFDFDAGDSGFFFYFPSLAQLQAVVNPALNENSSIWIKSLKAYRLLGLSSINSGTPNGPTEYLGSAQQWSSTTINLLYTPYIDIVSETLTKYQNVKDTDTSAQKLNSMIARVYLAGSGPPQFVTDGIAEQIGARPFTVTQDTQYPKVMRWSRDEAINSIDFQLRDQYGDLIFTSTRNLAQTAQYFFTEFQMTLLCVEGKKNY